MPSLHEQQRALHAAIVADRLPAGAGAREGVYRHAYRSRLAGALRTNYPVLASAVGDEVFEVVANAYARARPSRHFSIRWHGADLAAALPHPPSQDLARMEWALGVAFDAPDAAAFTEAEIARLPVESWSAIGLALHPSLQVIEMAFDVEPLWERVRAQGSGPSPPPVEHAHALFVWRRQLEAHWRTASLEEARALCLLHAHGSLEALCETLGDDGAQQAGAWFAGWVREEMLVAAGAA